MIKSNTGLLVTILESAAPAPLSEEELDRRRYITGKFADLICH